MQYSVAAVLALAATTVSAWGNGTVSYTTEVHTAYTTYCPASTTFSMGGTTYTVTEVSLSDLNGILDAPELQRDNLNIELKLSASQSPKSSLLKLKLTILFQATTLTITNCPCTIVKPVTTSSVVYCNTCSAYCFQTQSYGIN